MASQRARGNCTFEQITDHADTASVARQRGMWRKRRDRSQHQDERRDDVKGARMAAKTARRSTRDRRRDCEILEAIRTRRIPLSTNSTVGLQAPDQERRATAAVGEPAPSESIGATRSAACAGSRRDSLRFRPCRNWRFFDIRLAMAVNHEGGRSPPEGVMHIQQPISRSARRHK